MSELRWMVDGYEEWLRNENVRVVGGLAVDLKEVETTPWDRLGVDGVVVHLDARGDFLNMYLCDLPAAGETVPQHHLYEAVAYVVAGRGSTVIDGADGTTRSFEWGTGSLFTLPLNMTYRLLNGSGTQRARVALMTNLPMVMKLFRNQDFVFNTPHEFTERLGESKFQRGEGNFIPVREHRHMWETNLVPDLRVFDQLRESPGRGKGSSNIQFILGDGTLHAHVSSIPAGMYKKAHVHAEGYHIIQVNGHGYSLYWRPGEEPVRVEWTEGLLHSPSDGVWHQHFNIASEPARYMAVGFGSLRYPFTKQVLGVINRNYAEKSDIQIEYEDEDPAIRAEFERTCAEFARVGS